MNGARGGGLAGSRGEGPRASAGHALMELVVALPILAIGGAAAAGMVWTGGGLLTEAERRLDAALEGSSVLDSLTHAGASEPAAGTRPLPDGVLQWEWNGTGELTLRLPDGRRGMDGPVWVLVRGDPDAS